MKKVIAPATREKAVFYSDFSGKCFDQFGPNAEMTLKFNYGSKYDSAKIEIHLSDNDAEEIIQFLKTKLTTDCVDSFKKALYSESNRYNEAMDFRDWTLCEQISSSNELLKKLVE